MDNLSVAQRSYNMSRIRSSNTKLEVRFFGLLKNNHIRFKTHPEGIYGKPDCLISKNLAVFIDSDFWHGWHFSTWRERLPKKYWQEKISNNIARDKKKFKILRRQGYKVVRVWGHELKDLESSAKNITIKLGLSGKKAR